MKRSREEPCDVCDHYHLPQHVCGVCGHCSAEAASTSHGSGFGGGVMGPYPSEILGDARPMDYPGSSGPASGSGEAHAAVGLFLGGYDHVARPEFMKSLKILAVVNTVGPTCANLYRNSFAYFTCTPRPMPGQNAGGQGGLDLAEACLLIDTAIRTAASRPPVHEDVKPNVLVHCMSGVSRGPAAVVAFLMQRYGLGRDDAIAHVLARHPATKISRHLAQELVEFEARLRSAT